MADSDVIVGLVDRIDPPVDKMSGAELLRQNPSGAVIAFEGDRTARLTPSDAAAAILEILEQLRTMRAPAYVEINPNTREIIRLLIPLVTRVTKVEAREAEGADVELEASHARHRVIRENPAYAQLLTTLRAALEKRSWLAVTETDDHAIIDARPWTEPPTASGSSTTSAAPGSAEPALVRRFRWWPWPFWCWGCVSPARAQQLFNLVAATTCNPIAVPPPCIPFLYPDDGCWARAHEMCRLMIVAGASPKKIWIDGTLHTPTKNNPNCFVNWGWHVAPTLCVRLSFWHCEDHVIDPSLFTTPVTEAQWKGVQGDPNAVLTPTAASVYWRNVMPTDPGYVDTNFRLNFYRQQLKLRSLGPAGPPPYANC
jgi:Glutaminase